MLYAPHTLSLIVFIFSSIAMHAQTESLKAQALSLIHELDIAPYIAQEAEHFIQHLNSYKLQKICDQSDVFARYLCALDRENTMMIKRSIPLRKKKTPQLQLS